MWDAQFLDVDISPALDEYTRPEERGFHLLLKWWKEADPKISATVDELKTHVLMAKYGVAVRTLPQGQEIHIPLRRTTSVWDPDQKRYRRKKMSCADYADLIDTVYYLADQDGIVLPELEKEREPV